MFRDKTTYGKLSDLCAVLSWLVARWPVFVIALSLVSPISPHLRLSSADLYPSCAYGGVRGIIYEYDRSSCPIIALVNTRGRGQW